MKFLPFYSKRISTDDDISRYADKYYHFANYPLSSKFLAASHVRGFYVFGRIIGGYVLNNGPNFRALSFIPQEELELAENKLNGEINQYIEIGVNWMAPESKSWLRPILYMWVLIDVLRSGKKYIIIGTTVNKVKIIHRRAGLDKIIFDGELTIDEKTEPYWVYFGNRKDFLKNMLKSISKYLIFGKNNTYTS